MGGTRECSVEAAAAVPYRQPRRAWAGHGTGTLCDICQLAIEANQIEYEVELQGEADEVLYMHLHCYQHWAAHGGA